MNFDRFVRRQTTLHITLTFIGQHNPESLRDAVEFKLQEDFGPHGAQAESVVISDTFELEG